MTSPPPADGPRARLERAALALAAALETPGTEPSSQVRRQAEALRDAIAAEHPAQRDGTGVTPRVEAEHAELEQSAAGTLRAVAAWAGTADGDPARPSLRRQAVAAARALRDDLRVHHAHEA